MKIGNGSRLVMIGDSITDAGRTEPLGEGLFDPRGRGYVNFVEALLGATYPERAIRVTNVGHSGHTVRDLKERWQRDVLDLKPQWLSIMIGINDVWRQFDLPNYPETHVGIEEYEQTLEELIQATLPLTGGLVLMTPFYIEPHKDDAMRRQMDRYGTVVKSLADKYDAVFVDVQAAFDEVLKSLYSGTLAWDRVHPNQAGHMVIARAFLKAVEYEW